VVKEFWPVAASQGDFSVEKFNVTLSCFCGRPIERWSTAGGEISTSGLLGTVFGGLRENPGVIPLKSAPSRGDLRPHLTQFL